MTSKAPAPTHSRQSADLLLDLCQGLWAARAVHAAVEFGIADHLADRTHTAAELAELTRTHPPSLHRLLRALVTVGVLVESGPGRFALSPVGSTLRTGVAGSLAAHVLVELGESRHRAWGELTYALRTGESSFEYAVGQTPWQLFQADPEAGRTLGRAMAGLTENILQAVLEAYDLTRFTRIVDVGGNEGDFLDAVLAAVPRATGVLFDLPYVVENARVKGHRTLAERGELIGGDFFREVPSDGDLYLLKWVLHDWGDQDCRTILGNCRKAIRADGTLLVLNVVLPEGCASHPGALSDLNMLVFGSGRERTEEEFRSLFTEAGFRLTRVIPLGARDSLLELLPA